MKEHQLYVARPKLWNTLRRLHTVDKPYRRRSFFISRFVTITTFFQWLQRAIYGRRARKISFENNPPIFILGHWRSGTTHLHYAFSRDPKLGYLSNFQTFLYTVALLSKTWLRPVVSRFMPETRPQDNVKVDADAPAEEEQPLSMVSLCTGIHSFFFGRETAYFEKYTLFQGISAEEKAGWQEDYNHVLQQIALYNGTNNLVLKNPWNTPRVQELLELYPEAKFVFIHRNPYDVFLSTRHLMRKMISSQYLQFISMRQEEDRVIEWGKAIYERYIAQRSMIPEGNLVEVRFDVFEQNGYAEMERIYDELNLPGWQNAKGPIADYFESVKGYKKNRFRKLRPDLEQRIKKEWKTIFDTWNYSTELNEKS